MAGFELDRLSYGYLVNPASSVWVVDGSFLTMSYAIPCNLCEKAGVLQRKVAFAKSATMSVAVQNIGGEFFQPIGRVRSIDTNSSYPPSDGKNLPHIESIHRA